MIKSIFIDYTGTIIQEKGEDLEKLVLRIWKNSNFKSPEETVTCWWNRIKMLEEKSFGDTFLTEDEIVDHLLEMFEEEVGLVDDFSELHELFQRFWMYAPIFEDVKDIRTVEYDCDLFERQIQDKDMVLISNCNFCRPIIGLAKKYQKPLAVNVRSMRAEKIANKEDFLAAADILYISDDDLESDHYDCIKECREKYDPEIVIMGIGDKGVILYTKEDNSVIEYRPVKTNEIVNTIGAGNALFSSFMHYYVKTKNAKEAIKNALLFASYKIGFVGTSNGFMTEEQIEQWKKLIWL